MITDKEIWACANHYIRRHGEDAAIHAALRADKLLAAGEMQGAKVFQRIVERINQLQMGPSGLTH